MRLIVGERCALEHWRRASAELELCWYQPRLRLVSAMSCPKSAGVPDHGPPWSELCSDLGIADAQSIALSSWSQVPVFLASKGDPSHGFQRPAAARQVGMSGAAGSSISRHTTWHAAAQRSPTYSRVLFDSENRRRGRMETRAPDSKPTGRDVWMRGLFMLILIIGFAVGQWLLNLLAVVPFLWLLFAAEPNRFITVFGIALAQWLSEVGYFHVWATDEKPFPWKPWPPTVAAGSGPGPPASSG